ncbi:ankyrin repeat and KH domain-containing protein 1 [Patella vulgata]|uniref:ankyrin repeat and KH domain-containing protein 1 n=1 Tax=Patella vulgata TaxID=6465 RepID=UPI0021806CF6|nr:ankyrin repeat and KH domain-containing protein 1 [Patella vulgata]
MGNRKSKALLGSCEIGDYDSIVSLLKRGANVEYTDLYGNTPLLAAIKNHDYSPANTEHRDKTVNTPLMVAANNVDIVRLLINSGCQLNKTNRYKDSALHLAARFNNVEVVKLLVKSGIDVTLTNKKGRTAQHIASMHGHETIGNILVSNSPARLLRKALVSGERVLVHKLLERVASLDIALLEIPYRTKDSLMVEILIERYLNQDSPTCKCLLFYPVVKYRDVKWTKILIERGIPFDASFLDVAYANRDFEMVDTLIEKGLEHNIDQRSSKPMINYAVKHSDLKRVKILLEHGSHFDMLLLNVAYIHNDFEIVNILIEKGLEHNIDQTSGTPMIYYCAVNNDHEWVQKLLNHKSYNYILNRVWLFLDPTDISKATNAVVDYFRVDRNPIGFTTYEYYRCFFSGSTSAQCA